MPLNPRDIEASLSTKFEFTLATGQSRDHRYYELKLPGTARVWTKFSHHKGDIGPKLESQIARQLKVTKPYMVNMVRCTASKDDYYQLLGYVPPEA